MEHRYSSRITVAGDVGIYRAAAGWAIGRLIDMSTRGALIAVDRRRIRPNTPITVVLGIDRSGKKKWQLLHAVVVRNGPDGVGIEYLEHDERCAYALRCVIENGSHSPLMARGHSAGCTQRIAIPEHVDAGKVADQVPAHA